MKISRRGLFAGCVGIAGAAAVEKVAAAALLPPPAPRMMILVSGGRLSDESAQKIRDLMEKQMARGTYHKVLVLQDNVRIESFEL
jgi:hypothetical protein